MLLKPQWNWIIGLDNFFRYLSAAVTSTKSNMPTLSKTVAKGITVSGIEEFMKMSRELPLDHYSTVTIEGIYSEFPAILNLSLLFSSSAPLRAGYDFTKYTKLPAIPGPNFALPLRLKPVKGLGLASLHGNKSVSVYDNCLPLFSKVNNVHSLKNITGKR